MLTCVLYLPLPVKGLQRHLRSLRRLLAEFRNGGGFPKCRFSQRAGNKQISMDLASAVDGAAFGVGAKSETQGVVT